MSDLNKYRERIDEIDQEIIKYLSERMSISHLVGRYKFDNNLNIENIHREKEVLSKTIGLSYQTQITKIYQTILTKSKDIQKYDYFLVGKTLKHSLSPLVYSELGLDNYNLYETNDFSKIKDLNFLGINITNPYKDDAYLLCTKLCDEAVNSKVVNTLIRKDEEILGYNTDYFGIDNLVNYYKLDFTNKKVIIIGNGATSRTITEVLKTKNISKIIYLVRTVRDDNNQYLINEYNRFLDYDYIFNSTSYGTFPSEEELPLFPLADFKHLQAVIDVIYNPLSSVLLTEAKKYQIKSINGLYMLVSQAAKALSLYLGQDKLQLINQAYKNILRKLTNIVLIGMPYSGKTHMGNQLGILMNKKFVDIDQELAKDNMDLQSVLKTKTIDYFRSKEAEYTINFSKQFQLVIATGGGIVLNEKAMSFLKKNAVIVFVDVDKEILKTRIDDTRPLVKSGEDIDKLYTQRIDLYRKYADITITNDDRFEKIVEKIYEHISN